eukprot:621318-Alexandrium_andersonii.AAC.1
MSPPVSSARPTTLSQAPRGKVAGSRASLRTWPAQSTPCWSARPYLPGNSSASRSPSEPWLKLSLIHI